MLHADLPYGKRAKRSAAVAEIDVLAVIIHSIDGSRLTCHPAPYQKALDPSGLTDTEVFMRRSRGNTRSFRSNAKRVNKMNRPRLVRGGIRM